MTPVLTPVPGSPPTFSVGMAETFSWIPVAGAGRDLFAQAVYVVNPSGGGGGGGGGTTISLATVEARLDTITAQLSQQLGQNGFDIIQAGPTYNGKWTTLTVISSSARFSTLGALNSTGTNLLSSYDLPITFTMSGPFTSIKLSSGAVVAYK